MNCNVWLALITETRKNKQRSTKGLRCNHGVCVTQSGFRDLSQYPDTQTRNIIGLQGVKTVYRNGGRRSRMSRRQ